MSRLTKFTWRYLPKSSERRDFIGNVTVDPSKSQCFRRTASTDRLPRLALPIDGRDSGRANDPLESGTVRTVKPPQTDAVDWNARYQEPPTQRCGTSRLDYTSAPSPEWWNWQTRGIQNPVGLISRVGSSPTSGNELERIGQGIDCQSLSLGHFSFSFAAACRLLPEVFANCKSDCRCCE